MQIDDGRGKGYQAGVDANNRIMATSIVLDSIDNATLVGQSYNITTDVLALTNANESAIFYITNTNPLQTLSLYRMAFSLGKSNVPGDVIVKFYSNPTGGTLLSNGIELPFVQRNFGSRFVAQGLARRMSAVSQTLTGATLVSTRIFSDSSEAELAPGFQIPAGSSYAVTVTPNTGNNSMRVCVTTSIFYLDPPG